MTAVATHPDAAIDQQCTDKDQRLLEPTSEHVLISDMEENIPETVDLALACNEWADLYLPAAQESFSPIL